MKFEFKYKNYNLKKMFWSNLILTIIPTIGFYMNFTFYQFIEVLQSSEFWYSLPITFLITLPFVELLFVLISKNKDAISKFLKIFPFTVLAFCILLAIEFYFQLFGFNIIEFLSNYKIFLLNIIICLLLGLFKIEIKGVSLQFYYGINERVFVISGIFLLKGNSVYLSIGAPSILARNKSHSNESPNS